MKKVFSIFMAVLLALLAAGCAPAGPDPSVSGGPGMITDFTVLDINGETFDTRALRGKILIINFWASWCGPCREEMPFFQEASQKLGDDTAFIAIDSPGDMDAGAIKTFLEENGYTFRAAPDNETDGAGKLFHIAAIPATLFIDPSGKLSYMQSAKFRSAAEILEKVDEIRKSHAD